MLFWFFFLTTKILKKCAVLETQNVSAALCYTLVKNVQLVKITTRWQYTTREIGFVARFPLNFPASKIETAGLLDLWL